MTLQALKPLQIPTSSAYSQDFKPLGSLAADCVQLNNQGVFLGPSTLDGVNGAVAGMLGSCVINTGVSCYMSLGQPTSSGYSSNKLSGVGLVAGSVRRKQVGDNPLDVESSVASPNLLLKTSGQNLFQRRVPRFYYFTTIGETQTLVTKLMPTMQVVKLHVLCECKTGSHVVVGQEGCEVIIEDQEREIIQSLMVQGQKWVFLAIKARPAYVTLKVGNMVVPIEANTDFMGAMQGLTDVKFDENLVGEPWLVNFLRDKEIRRAFNLEGVTYMDDQGRAVEFAWLCKQHLVEGLQSRTLCQLPTVEELQSKFRVSTSAILAANRFARGGARINKKVQ